MAFYRLTDRSFSRRWRRSKTYTEKQIVLLAKREGCLVEKSKYGVSVKKGDKVIATFEEVLQNEAHHENTFNSKRRLYASLRNPVRAGAVRTIPVAVSVATVAGESRRGSSNG